MYKLTMQNVADFCNDWVKKHKDKKVVPIATEKDVLEYWGITSEWEEPKKERKDVSNS